MPTEHWLAVTFLSKCGLFAASRAVTSLILYWAGRRPVDIPSPPVKPAALEAVTKSQRSSNQKRKYQHRKGNDKV